jgi:hypothetical protein
MYNVTGQCVTIFEDNEGCIKLAENDTSTKRTKHIDVRFHFLRETVQEGKVELAFVRSYDQLADVLTKNVRGEILARLARRAMGMID